MSEPLPLGKLPSTHLARFLDQLSSDPSVIVGPALGEDAAVLRLADAALLVASADPITFPTPRPGWYAVHVNANDVATRGGAPRWFLATLLLPSGTSARVAEQLLEDVAQACGDVGAQLVGGHTEISGSVIRPVVSGCMLGAVAPNRLRRTGGGQAGDLLIVAGHVGVEGTSILATVAARALRAARMPSATIAAAASLVGRYGISVLPAASVAAPLAHAMHDLTEGGLATAIHELAEASNLAATVELDVLPLLPETQALCQSLNLDPLGLLSSGCLLIAASRAVTPELLRQLAASGVAASLIGRLEGGTGARFSRGSAEGPLATFARDEVARWLDEHPPAQNA